MKPLAWSILLVLPVGAIAADVYRSVDENGVVVYSDVPSGNAQRVQIRVPAPSGGGQAPAAGSQGAADASGSSSSIYSEIPREPTPEEIAANRARNCEYARQMLETYSIARRLYREGPDGEREYLSDAEIDEARAQAEANVAAWCD